MFGRLRPVPHGWWFASLIPASLAKNGVGLRGIDRPLIVPDCWSAIMGYRQP